MILLDHILPRTGDISVRKISNSIITLISVRARPDRANSCSLIEISLSSVADASFTRRKARKRFFTNGI